MWNADNKCLHGVFKKDGSSDEYVELEPEGTEFWRRLYAAMLEDLEAVDEEWAELRSSISKREDGTWRMNGWDERMVVPPPSPIWNPPVKKER